MGGELRHEAERSVDANCSVTFGVLMKTDFVSIF
jgi:hypothetical protein